MLEMLKAQGQSLNIRLILAYQLTQFQYLPVQPRMNTDCCVTQLYADFSIQHLEFDLFFPHMQMELNLLPAAFQMRIVLFSVDEVPVVNILPCLISRN
jgi:hypothetical protein